MIYINIINLVKRYVSFVFNLDIQDPHFLKNYLNSISRICFGKYSKTINTYLNIFFFTLLSIINIFYIISTLMITAQIIFRNNIYIYFFFHIIICDNGVGDSNGLR